MGYKGESIMHVVTLHLHLCGKVLGVTEAQAWVVQKIDIMLSTREITI